jgi:tRNA threonylcarbamoyl adenosine modification protein YeaZ
VLLLGLDTATSAVTVAVYDGSAVLGERTTVDPRRHGELVAPSIEAVLKKAGAAAPDLTAVTVGVGPGPYTGLRVGVATALAIADAIGIPAHGVCTLDVLAADAGRGEPVTVVTDARRREVFWANYDEWGVRIAGPAVDRPDDAAALALPRVVGAGAALYPDAFGPSSDPRHPAAAVLCALTAERLAAAGELLPVLPVYLRRPDAVEPQAPKSVLAR